MSPSTDTNKLDNINVTKVDAVHITNFDNKDRDLLLAQLLCDLEGIVQASRELQGMSRRVQVSTGNSRQTDHPCSPPKRFRRREALVKHRRTRHRCKPYSCDYANCSEAFSDSEELENHRSREHSKCLFCGEAFLNSAGLKLHLRKCRVLEEVIAESEVRRWEEADEQNARPASASSNDSSGYSSSPDQSLIWNPYDLE